MYLVCNSYRGAINIKSMRTFNNESDVQRYFSTGSARANGISKWGMRVYYFDAPGVPAKRVTPKFKDSFK